VDRDDQRLWHFSEAVRGHWGIESMHWVLDVNFREDDSRTRERTLANNLSWLQSLYWACV